MNIGTGLTEVNEHLVGLERAHVAQQFEDLEVFAAHLVALGAVVKLSNRLALGEVGKLVTADARSQIGEYQDAVGNYPAWEPLAESTEDEKARLGAPPDAPLLRWGDLVKSFRYSVEADNEVVIGSTDEVMVYHEFGTVKMPPRPVLGPALLKNIDRVREILGFRTFEALVVGPHLGYRLSESGGFGDKD